MAPEAETRRWMIRELEGRLAECYRLTGSDPDGDSDSMLANLAVAAVKELREEGDEAQAQHDALYSAVEEEVERYRGLARGFKDRDVAEVAETIANRLDAILKAAGEKREVPDYGDVIEAARVVANRGAALPEGMSYVPNSELHTLANELASASEQKGADRA